MGIIFRSNDNYGDETNTRPDPDFAIYAMSAFDAGQVLKKMAEIGGGGDVTVSIEIGDSGNDIFVIHGFVDDVYILEQLEAACHAIDIQAQFAFEECESCS